MGDASILRKGKKKNKILNNILNKRVKFIFFEGAGDISNPMDLAGQKKYNYNLYFFFRGSGCFFFISNTYRSNYSFIFSFC